MQCGTQLKQLKENEDVVVILVHNFLGRKPEQGTVVGCLIFHSRAGLEKCFSLLMWAVCVT
jgi:hypothetical protein